MCVAHPHRTPNSATINHIGTNNDTKQLESNAVAENKKKEAHITLAAFALSGCSARSESKTAGSKSSIRFICSKSDLVFDLFSGDDATATAAWHNSVNRPKCTKRKID